MIQKNLWNLDKTYFVQFFLDAKCYITQCNAKTYYTRVVQLAKDLKKGTVHYIKIKFGWPIIYKHFQKLTNILKSHISFTLTKEQSFFSMGKNWKTFYTDQKTEKNNVAKSEIEPRILGLTCQLL